MGLFENKKYYNKEEFDKISYDDQKLLFLKIRAWVPNVDEKYKYDSELYRKLIINRIGEICTYACSGHIPAQDYMGYIYKRGFANVFPKNYKRSLEWNIIAARNGSKIAPEKMRAFMNPAIDMIALSPRWAQIIAYNDLNLSNYFWFLSQYVCELLYKELDLDPVKMSKKELIEEDPNDYETQIFMDRFRDRCVNQAIEDLTKELPADTPVNEEYEEYSKQILKKASDVGDEDTVFEDIEIDDIHPNSNSNS